MSLPKEGSRDIYEGIIVSAVPDICLTPAGGDMVPVPYTIWCLQADAANLANSVRQTNERSHAVASVVLHCNGDEPGTGGGILSGTTGAECTPKTWSPTVRVEDRNMVRHLDQWWMNHRNTFGQLIYVKNMQLYDTPSAEEIAPLIKNQQTTPEPGGGSIPQVSQLAQASIPMPVPEVPYVPNFSGGNSYIPPSWNRWGNHLTDSIHDSISHALGHTDEKVLDGQGINQGVRVSDFKGRDYCPSPKHNKNKPWKGADPMDLEDREAWRVLNQNSVAIPGTTARAAIYNKKLYIFQSDDAEPPCYHGYNVTGNNKLNPTDLKGLRALKDYFNDDAGGLKALRSVTKALGLKM